MKFEEITNLLSNEPLVEYFGTQRGRYVVRWKHKDGVLEPAMYFPNKEEAEKYAAHMKTKEGVQDVTVSVGVKKPEKKKLKKKINEAARAINKEYMELVQKYSKLLNSGKMTTAHLKDLIKDADDLRGLTLKQGKVIEAIVDSAEYPHQDTGWVLKNLLDKAAKFINEQK